MSNQGFRYVSSCFSCDRLASTAVIGWEAYLLHLQYIITCVSVGYLHGKDCKLDFICSHFDSSHYSDTQESIDRVWYPYNQRSLWIAELWWASFRYLSSFFIILPISLHMSGVIRLFHSWIVIMYFSVRLLHGTHQRNVFAHKPPRLWSHFAI